MSNWRMRAKLWSLPRRRIVAATTAVAGLAVLVGSIAAIRRMQLHDMSIKATASLAAGYVESAQGQELVRRFESMRGIPLSFRDGFTVFMFGTWQIEGKFESRCQVQLAVHSPDDWHLIDWTSDHKTVNGTINSWGTIQEDRSHLRDYRNTLTLATVRAGNYALAWQPPGYAQGASTLKAKVLYACGNADKHPKEFDVTVDQTARR